MTMHGATWLGRANRAAHGFRARSSKRLSRRGPSSDRPPRVGALVLSALVVVASLAVGQRHAAAVADVLILGTTVTGGSTSLEAQAVTAAGLTFEIADAATWGAKTAADFASYKAIVLGDPTCGTVSAIDPATANRSTWGPTITGNVVIVGTDPVYHSFNGPGSNGGPSGPHTLINKGVAFAVGDPGKTGAYITLSCYYHDTAPHTPVPLLDAFVAGGFTVTGVGCFNDAHIVASSPALDGLSDTDLSNWTCSVHEAFDTWPASFQVLAIARNIGSSFTATDGSVGTPYILARGSAVSPITDFGSSFPYTYGGAQFQNGAMSPDPVNLGTGAFSSHSTDLAMPGRVIPFVFERWYNSADTASSPLGPSWTHSFHWRLTDSGGTVEIRRGDGRRDSFTRNLDGTYAAPPNVFDTLTKNADATFTLTLTSQTQYEFSASGLLTRIHEPAGNQLVLAYTGANLSTITDTVGRQIALAYDGSNRLTQIQDPLGRKATYAYDASGRLATVTDKLGNALGQTPSAHQWRYAYDGSTHHVATITDPDGRVRVTNIYDVQGRVSQQRDGLGALSTFVYSSGQTVLTDPRSHATTYTFDSRMRVLSQADVIGANTYTLSYVYDAAGNRTSVTDRNGKTTDFTYDSRGNVLTKTDPQVDPLTPRFVTQFSYDTKNNVSQITDPRGFLTTMGYHATTNVLLSVGRQIDASTNALTKYEYGDAANPGLPTKLIAPRGNIGAIPDNAFATTLTYDARGNLTTRIDPDGAKTTFAYDAAGRLTSFVDPDGNATGANPAEHTWTVSQDENDRETRSSDPLGNALLYGYDGAGDRTSLTDRRGNATTYTYDANTRLASVRQKPDPVGNPTLVYTTQQTRDANGNATRITQGNGVATDYDFDALNRLTTVSTHPNAQTTLTTSYVLDGNGQPTTRTTADGVSLNYAYDALSRVTSVAAPGLATITYGYDATSNRTRMTDGVGTTTYAYDGLGRLTSAVAPNGALSYAYDRDGNRTTLGYPGSQNVTYAYSPGGRLNTVTDWASRVSNYTYQASGLASTLQYPNGTRASYTYDRAQRLTQLVNAVGATTITRDAYTLDPEGNRTALDEFVQGITPPGAAWSASVKVNDDTGTAVEDNPALALGPDGAGYLVWEDSRNGNSDVFFGRRSPGTDTWSANLKLNNDTGTRGQRAPAIAVDGSNNAYAVWEDDRNGGSQIDTDIYFSKRTAATGTWSANVRVNNDTQARPAQTKPRIAVTSGGEATAVWLDPRQNQQNIYAATLPSGSSTWSANQRVSDNTSSSKSSPDVAVGPDGTAYAVWVDKRTGSGDVYYATRAPGSSVWSANVRVSDIATATATSSTSSASPKAPIATVAPPTPSAISQVRIGVDATNNALTVWSFTGIDGPDQVYSQSKPQGSSTWQPSRLVRNTGGGGLGGLALAVASDGRAVTAWHDFSSGNADVYGSDYDPSTQTWSASQTFSDDPGTADQFDASVALSVSELGVVWRDDRAGNGDIRARRRSSGSGVDHFTYTYDGLNRLTSVAGTNPETFTFDAATNITTRSGPSATNSYDTSNRQTSDGTRTSTWSPADRLVQRGSDTFAYDPLGRLTSSTVAASTRAYTYNGDGLLNSVAITNYLWDVAVAPTQLLQAGTDKVVYGLGPLYAVRADASTYTFARDGLGSVRAELTDTGTTTKSFRYNAYGAMAAAPSGSPSLVGFAGELTDTSGLIYLRARWYDPGAGRFTTRDGFLGSARTPGSLNGFSYALGRPTLLTDALGLDPSSSTSSSDTNAALIPHPGDIVAFLRGIGAFVGSDYVRIQGNIRGFSLFGPGSSLTIDRYGNVYVQPLGLSAGTPGAAFAVTVGWLLQLTKPSERDLRSFLEGPSYSGGTALGAAVNVVTSPFATGTKVAVESGVGSPYAGVSGGTAFFVQKLPLGW
jgi:RHS repeat-associated protein